MAEGRRDAAAARRKGRVEHHPFGRDVRRFPAPHAEGPLRRRVHHAIAAATVREHRDRPPVAARHPGEGGPAPSPPPGREGDAASAHRRAAGEGQVRLERIGGGLLPRPAQRSRDADRVGDELHHRLGRGAAARGGGAALLPRSQNGREVALDVMARRPVGLANAPMALSQRFRALAPQRHRVEENQGAEAVDGRPEGPGEQRPGGVDGGHPGLLAARLDPGALRERQDVAGLDPQIRAPHEADRPVRRHPDDVQVVGAQRAARRTGHVRLGLQQRGFPRNRARFPSQELGEPAHPVVDPGHQIHVERALGQAGAPSLDDDRASGRDTEQSEDTVAEHRARRPQRDRAGGDAGGEGPPAHDLRTPELGREDVQMTLLDHVDAPGIVQRQRAVGAGRERRAPDAFDEVRGGHELSSMRRATGTGPRRRPSAARASRAGRRARPRER